MSSTAGTETDPSPTRTGLVKAFGRKSRRNKKQDASLNSSQHSTMSLDGSNENKNHPHGGKLRSSIDAAIEKIKTGTGPESEERRKSDSRALPGLQGLLRRTKRRSRRASSAVKAEEVERGRSVAQRGTLEDDPTESPSTSTTRPIGDGGSSSNQKEESDQESSLITDDSETES